MNVLYAKVSIDLFDIYEGRKEFIEKLLTHQFNKYRLWN